MATTNDVTGDSLTSKSTTDAFRTNWDNIFTKKAVLPAPVGGRCYICGVFDDHTPVCQLHPFKQSRSVTKGHTIH